MFDIINWWCIYFQRFELDCRNLKNKIRFIKEGIGIQVARHIICIANNTYSCAICVIHSTSVFKRTFCIDVVLTHVTRTISVDFDEVARCIVTIVIELDADVAIIVELDASAVELVVRSF